MNNLLSISFLLAAFSTLVASAEEKLSFNEHIRPILNSKCTKCHGGAIQKGDLSLIYREQALGKGKSGKINIVPGHPEKSELFRRIITDDIDDKMPLQTGDHAEDPLPPHEVELIKKWIEQGAEWEEHYAYVKPKNHPLPELKNKTWGNSKLDKYVLANLEENNLEPTSEAPRAQWLRRASLDLTGLPPTDAELSAFLADQSPDAYQKQADRLLASPAYGERWATVWMDLARYSDTMGFEKDPHRNIWPYRDYLISSFNDDKPYDQFLREQLAGDLMPNATSDQILATAFHRNTQTNSEGGTDDEEYRVMATIDRVNTTWAATQGITFGCIQCHDHPYEPIPHADYYRFYAFFNSTEDADLHSDVPLFKIASNPQQRPTAAELYHQIPVARQAINAPGAKALAEHKNWTPLKYTSVKTTSGELKAYPDGQLRTSGTQAVHTRFNLIADSSNFSAIKLTIIPETENPAELPERGSVLSQIRLQKIKADGSKENLPISYIFADNLAGPYDPEGSIHGGADGFGGYPKLFNKREALIVTREPVTFETGETLAIALENKASTAGNQATTLRRFTLETSNDPKFTELIKSKQFNDGYHHHKKLTNQYNKIKGTAVPIIQQRPENAKRETRLFIGGLWLNKGDVYTEGVPELLNPEKKPATDRLEMAKWLASPDNPLTARVMANRLFDKLFGRGIVSTLGDFGTTGTKPSNLPLLDHLAIEFQTTHKWSVKSMLREMVLSSTYRQDHNTTPEIAKRDPMNVLLARGPRTRLSAEMVRDQALTASALLTRKQGGPSVMPPQPDGIWQSVYSGSKWTNATGPNRYRRAVYTYWKRTSPYPSMITFDAPSRDICSTQRIPTNTPLHALITLNDPVYLETSKALANRMTKEGGPNIKSQINFAYKTATQKNPTTQTTNLLADLHAKLLADYQKHPEKSKEIAETPQRAAHTVLANTILNLDTALTK